MIIYGKLNQYICLRVAPVGQTDLIAVQTEIINELPIKKVENTAIFKICENGTEQVV
jgi:hypothetical protein